MKHYYLIDVRGDEFQTKLNCDCDWQAKTACELEWERLSEYDKSKRTEFFVIKANEDENGDIDWATSETIYVVK